jgi:hypothetical protein
MLFNTKAVLSLASVLAAFPAVLAAVLQDTSGQPYGGHVDYEFDIANGDIQPVSTFLLALFPILIEHGFQDGYTRSAVLVNG